MNAKPKAKALVLLSGGLDSGLAAKLMLEQGLDVVALKFTSPLCNCDQKGRCFARDAAAEMGIPFRMVAKGSDYIDIIRSPRHGYGSGMNPCIDCRIYALRKAWAVAEEVGADFLVTGDVLNQRPMSQHRRALDIIDRETGLGGLILRPLSAAFLPETEPERAGVVDRSKLLSFSGRTRRPQLELAARVGLDTFACAAGGCLLTDKRFAVRLRDLFGHRRKVTWRDISLLKFGRHFRLGRSKVVVGRDEVENRALTSLRLPADLRFEVPDCGSPVTLLQGSKSGSAIRMAAALTVRYADCPKGGVSVSYGCAQLDRRIDTSAPAEGEVERMRLG